MQKITPCLWFDTQAEEAARFYASIFKKSKIGRITRYGERMPLPKGTVLTVSLTIEGQEFTLLNGGPVYKFTEAVSFVVSCKTQKEIDRFWDKLSEGAQIQQCGWLKDKFGVSWQVTPADIGKLISGPGAGRVMAALMPMKKIDIAALRAASRGK